MRPLVAVVPVLLLVGACGRPASRSAANRPDSLTFALHNEPPTLDPGVVQDVDAGGLLQDVYEGLVGYSTDNAVVPRLAASWTVSSDGRTYTFKLRPDAKFHNGRAVTAADVKWTMERNLAPALASPTAKAYLGDIVGALAYAAGKAKEVAGIKANGDVVAITIDQPRAYFLGKLTYPCAFPLAKEVVGTARIGSPASSIGTGPFRMTEYKPSQSVELTAFDGYYGGKPTVARVRRPIVKDAATRLTKYRSGGLDMLTLERQDLSGVSADPKLKGELVPQPRPAIYFLALNPKAYAPFADVRVRRAFAMAIDRKRIAEDVIGLPMAAGLLPPGLPGYRADVKAIPYDVAAARALLTEAGFPGGKGLPPLTISFRAGRPDSERMATAAVTDLRRNLGVTVSGGGMEFAALLDARRAGRLQMTGLSWYGDYLDAQNFLSLLFQTGADQNYESFSDPEFDRLTRAADTATDPALRARDYAAAEDLLLAKAVRIPVYFAQDPLLVKPYVKGLETNLFGTMPARNVRIER